MKGLHFTENELYHIHSIRMQTCKHNKLYKKKVTHTHNEIENASTCAIKI